MANQALDAPRYTGFFVDPEDILIETDPTHPLFDPQAAEAQLDERIARQFLAIGVQQDTLAVKRNDKLVAIDGRHRILHARLANKIAKAEGTDPIKIRVYLKKGTDKELAGITLATDVRKKFDPIKHAQKIQRYLDGGHTIQEAAAALCISDSTIQNRLALLTLSSPAQQAVKDGYVSMTEAVEELKGLTEDAQSAKLASWKFARTKVETTDQGDGTVTTKLVVAKTRAKKAKPGKRALVQAYEFLKGQETAKSKVQAQLLGWVLGKVTAQALAEEIADFPIPVKKPKRAKKKAVKQEAPAAALKSGPEPEPSPAPTAKSITDAATQNGAPAAVTLETEPKSDEPKTVSSGKDSLPW